MKISIRSVNRDALVRAAVYALLFLFAAHAFCFFNLTYSTQSVMINASKGTSAQIGGGQYLLTFYWRLRGAIAAPLWVGLLSAVYLTLSVGVAAWLLRLAFALCALWGNDGQCRGDCSFCGIAAYGGCHLAGGAAQRAGRCVLCAAALGMAAGCGAHGRGDGT